MRAQQDKDGSSIEVAQGDLHIVLQEPGDRKVYVSVAGGEEIELFDLATRLATLEASSKTDKAEMLDTISSLQDKIDALTSTSDDLVDRADLNGDSAQSLQQVQDGNILPALSKLQDSSTAQSTLITALTSQADAAAKALAVVPKMAECAADGKIYHPESQDCQVPVSIHCSALTTGDDSAMMVEGSNLADAALCSFNQHYGGQDCVAICKPGYAAFKVDPQTGNKEEDGFNSDEKPKYTCSSDGQWQSNFGCTLQSCAAKPTSSAASSSVKVKALGAEDQDHTIGATLVLDCDGKLNVVTARGEVDTITCIAEKEDPSKVMWSASSFTAGCTKELQYDVIREHLGCHAKVGGNNYGSIGRPEVFLDDYEGSCRCPSNTDKACVDKCIAIAKRACLAIRNEGKDCWGFGMNPRDWGVQMYNSNAEHVDCNDNEYKLKPSRNWDIYKVKK